MDKELGVISEIMQWLEQRPLSLEELRQKNIQSASQVCYSTLGHCVTTKGCFEMANEYWLCRNERYGHFLTKKPSKLSCHYTYYLDDNKKLLCAIRTDKQCGAFVTNEDHHLIDWNEHTIVYGSTFREQPIDQYSYYTIYMFDNQRVYAKVMISLTSIDLYYFFYTDEGEYNKMYKYSFYTTTFYKTQLKQPVSQHKVKMINGTAYTYDYLEYR